MLAPHQQLALTGFFAPCSRQEALAASAAASEKEQQRRVVLPPAPAELASRGRGRPRKVQLDRSGALRDAPDDEADAEVEVVEPPSPPADDDAGVLDVIDDDEARPAAVKHVAEQDKAAAGKHHVAKKRRAAVAAPAVAAALDEFAAAADDAQPSRRGYAQLSAERMFQYATTDGSVRRVIAKLERVGERSPSLGAVCGWRKVAEAASARAEGEVPPARVDAAPPNPRSVAERRLAVHKRAKEYAIAQFEKLHSTDERSRARLVWSDATERAAALHLVALRAAGMPVSLATVRAALTSALMQYEPSLLSGDGKLMLTGKTLKKFLDRHKFSRRRMPRRSCPRRSPSCSRNS